jgi:hypothetical protein
VNGPLRIVIVGGGHAEDGHEAVAHDLRHRAPVLLDHEAQVGHPGTDSAIDVFRVEGLGQGRVARQVREEDRHDLPLRGQDRLAAGGAGDRAWRQLGSARRAARDRGVGHGLPVNRRSVAACHRHAATPDERSLIAGTVRF